MGKIFWIRGNTQSLIIPLEQEVMTQAGEIVAEPYYPDENATVTVYLVGSTRHAYVPTIDGNLLTITDNGSILRGCYGLEVVVENRDGSRLRSFWDDQVVVTRRNDSVLKEWDEFKKRDIEARAALFFFARGPQGEAGPSGGFLYPSMDFDPETGVLTISGADTDVNRIRYDENTAELVIRLANETDNN